MNIRENLISACLTAALLASTPLVADYSVARQWNEVLLEAIRSDLARPTVHARNLFHTSVVMYDAWAAYDSIAEPFLLGKRVDGFTCAFSGTTIPADRDAARAEAISFAAYRLLRHRFASSPGAEKSLREMDELLSDLGYEVTMTSTDYASGPPGALGNYIAECMINFGLHDGANEQAGYESAHYEPMNPPLAPDLHGNPDILDPNRWQPLAFDVFIDQAGNVVTEQTPEFVSPEWGKVVPFALRPTDRSIYERDGAEYWVYLDPGPPPYLDPAGDAGFSSEYKWGFELVALWSSHLDPADGVMWDISPASIGNIQDYPETFEEYREFYDSLNGGDSGFGHSVNPHTNEPYEPQIVPRADYARVLAEFWADGPDSETPPGHWFTILNSVSDHPLLQKRFGGEGAPLTDLEWDVKAYFVLGGAVHDAAVAAWGIKGWYDYVRPISAIRYMADQGQSSDPLRSNYSSVGLPLIDGLIEEVEVGDPLAGFRDRHVGKIKLFSWLGPDYIDDPLNDVAGCGWIRAEDWWPYQRPTFVTPPFAGYVSGHSTFSRAAAEVLTLLTGDEFFPGGMAEFNAPKNEFLVFEDGPSVDVRLSSGQPIGMPRTRPACLASGAAFTLRPTIFPAAALAKESARQPFILPRPISVAAASASAAAPGSRELDPAASHSLETASSSEINNGVRRPGVPRSETKLHPRFPPLRPALDSPPDDPLRSG